VAHRDLKPENILVQHRDPDRSPHALCIKLSDFGLAKASDSLKTGCGTETYCPPEVQLGKYSRHTKAVDIWSLGVVILRFAYGLPYPGSGIGTDWCRNIVQEANEWESEGLIDLLQRMLVINAAARPTAASCYRQASQLLTSSEDRSATPTPASYAGQGGEEEETVRVLPYEVCCTTI
jgi:serine/threonine-protein kinase Chk2